jgi:hypothetical protein
MNPMADKLYRNYQASELTREIARETQIQAALQARPVNLSNASNPIRFTVSRRLVTLFAGARSKARPASSL